MHQPFVTSQSSLRTEPSASADTATSLSASEKVAVASAAIQREEKAEEKKKAPIKLINRYLPVLLIQCTHFLAPLSLLLHPLHLLPPLQCPPLESRPSFSPPTESSGVPMQVEGQ